MAGRKPKYPWDELRKAGDSFIMEDHTTKVSSFMRANMSNYPKHDERYGYSVTVVKQPDGKTKVTRV